MTDERSEVSALSSVSRDRALLAVPFPTHEPVADLGCDSFGTAGRPERRPYPRSSDTFASFARSRRGIRAGIQGMAVTCLAILGHSTKSRRRPDDFSGPGGGPIANQSPTWPVSQRSPARPHARHTHRALFRHRARELAVPQEDAADRSLVGAHGRNRPPRLRRPFRPRDASAGHDDRRACCGGVSDRPHPHAFGAGDGVLPRLAGTGLARRKSAFGRNRSPQLTKTSTIKSPSSSLASRSPRAMSPKIGT